MSAISEQVGDASGIRVVSTSAGRHSQAAKSIFTSQASLNVAAAAAVAAYALRR